MMIIHGWGYPVFRFGIPTQPKPSCYCSCSGNSSASGVGYQAITLEWENDVINLLDFDGFLDYPKLSCREQPRI